MTPLWAVHMGTVLLYLDFSIMLLAITEYHIFRKERIRPSWVRHVDGTCSLPIHMGMRQPPVSTRNARMNRLNVLHGAAV